MHVYFGYLTQDAVPLNHALLHNSENGPSFSCPFPAPVPEVKDQYVSAMDNQANLRGVQGDRINGLILHPSSTIWKLQLVLYTDFEDSAAISILSYEKMIAYPRRL